MDQMLIVGTIGVIVVVLVNSLAPRFGVAAPLLLVVLGIGVSLMPFVDPIEVNPDVILGGMLPLLLYSTAVNTPVMEFRRDLPTISVFAVLLVVASAVGVGFLLMWMLPGLPLGIAIAVGAIVSPTDAVATTIVRQSGVSQRIVSVLEGEALFNDASALVLLRSAVAAVSASFSIWDIAVDFVYAVVVAVVIGLAVGFLNLAVRRRISQVSCNVAFSLIVPFLAFIPAEHLGASGLVAAVVAGLVTGEQTVKYLPSEVRVAEHAVWRTVELLLESAIFLIMGLELFSLHEDAVITHQNEWLALRMGAAAVGVVLVTRIVFVWVSVWLLARRTKGNGKRHEHIALMQKWLNDPDGVEVPNRFGRRLRKGDERSRLQRILERQKADLDYLAAEKFGWKDGVILVAAGMRGAITLAAAQSLPMGTPYRSLLILTAFVVATGTLLLQGGTLGVLVKALKIPPRDASSDGEMLNALQKRLGHAALEGLNSGQWNRADGRPYSPETINAARNRIELMLDVEDEDVHNTEASELRIEIIELERAELLRIRDLGTFPSELLESSLSKLDAERFGVEMRLR